MGEEREHPRSMALPKKEGGKKNAALRSHHQRVRKEKSDVDSIFSIPAPSSSKP